MQDSQKDKVTRMLIDLAINVTREDRVEFVEMFPVSEATISNYLNGRVSSLDTAFKMLQYFQKKIDEREKVISQPNPITN